ncbi:hypothetical protein [Kangiella sediminilitoris]|uniref:Permease n=1 Tax=Kangiella sediminilitoris TaxID=1144748 RepID=A0A1B3BAB6_9GAMM|nr:hypothetical protein [Kangiella sediminilitoris]AOE49735.1 Permease [Kangiella sediminilitoris]
MLLLLSLIALLIGPLMLKVIGQNRRMDDFLFPFVLVSVGSLLIFDVLPVLWSNIGFALFPLLLLGFFGPALAEITFRRFAHKTHSIALILGITGLMTHSAIDGAAVVTVEGNEMLPYAVILHRLVVGLSLWWIVNPLWGSRRSAIVFGFMLIATTAGFYIGEKQLFGLHNIFIDYFQAIVSGTLLHVIIHRPHSHEHGEGETHVHKHEEAAEQQFISSIHHKGYFITGLSVAVLLVLVLHQLHH